MKTSIKYENESLQALLKELSYDNLEHFELELMMDTISQRRKKILAEKCTNKGSRFSVDEGAQITTHDFNEKILVVISVNNSVEIGLATDDNKIFRVWLLMVGNYIITEIYKKNSLDASVSLANNYLCIDDKLVNMDKIITISEWNR